MLALALVLGVVLFGAAAIVSWLWFNYPLVNRLNGAALIFVFSPILTVPVLLASAPFVVWAALRGWFGWAVAIAWGLIAATGVLWVLDAGSAQSDLVLFVPVNGTIFGALYWVSAKIFAPAVLTAP